MRDFNRTNPLTMHLRDALSSLGFLYRRPWGTFMTCLVIALALTLPSGLFSIVSVAQGILDQKEQHAAINVFLQKETDQQKVIESMTYLRERWPDFEMQSATPNEALMQYKSGFDLDGNIFSSITENNPFPSMILINPGENSDNAKLEALLLELRDHPQVDMVLTDLKWMSRVENLLVFMQRTTIILSLVLALAVLSIIWNTIRLCIEARKEEIETIRLVGGSDDFICRPFLYLGFWLGSFGGLISAVLIYAIWWVLGTPLLEFLPVDTSTSVGFKAVTEIVFAVVLFGILLGITGAWATVMQRLKQIQI